MRRARTQRRSLAEGVRSKGIREVVSPSEGQRRRAVEVLAFPTGFVGKFNGGHRVYAELAYRSDQVCARHSSLWGWHGCGGGDVCVFGTERT